MQLETEVLKEVMVVHARALPNAFHACLDAVKSNEQLLERPTSEISGPRFSSDGKGPFKYTALCAQRSPVTALRDTCEPADERRDVTPSQSVGTGYRKGLLFSMQLHGPVFG